MTGTDPGVIEGKIMEENNKRANLLEELEVYTDGACFRNGKEDARASIGIWFGIGHPLNVSKTIPVKHRQTNNTAEILAAVEAVKQCEIIGNKNVCIKTDSELLVGAWEKAIKIWQLNNWKTSAGKPVRHRRELGMLIDEVEKSPGMKLRIEHVQASRHLYRKPRSHFAGCHGY